MTIKKLCVYILTVILLIALSLSAAVVTQNIYKSKKEIMSTTDYTITATAIGTKLNCRITITEDGWFFAGTEKSVKDSTLYIKVIGTRKGTSDIKGLSVAFDVEIANTIKAVVMTDNDGEEKAIWEKA